LHGADEDERDSFRLKLEERDYVKQGGLKLVIPYMMKESVKEVAEIVNFAFHRVNILKRTPATALLMELYVDRLLLLAKESCESASSRKLVRSFAQEIQNGSVSETNVRLAAFVAAGKADQHTILPGLLFGAYRHDKGLTNLLGANNHNNLAAEKILEASVYFANRLRCKPDELKELNLSVSSHVLNRSAGAYLQLLATDTEFGTIELPRPYNAICFPGAIQENVKRSVRIIDLQPHVKAEVAVVVKPAGPTPLYMIMDATYLARCHDISDRLTFYDNEIHAMGYKHSVCRMRVTCVICPYGPFELWCRGPLGPWAYGIITTCNVSASCHISYCGIARTSVYYDDASGCDIIAMRGVRMT